MFIAVSTAVIVRVRLPLEIDPEVKLRVCVQFGLNGAQDITVEQIVPEHWVPAHPPSNDQVMDAIDPVVGVAVPCVAQFMPTVAPLWGFVIVTVVAAQVKTENRMLKVSLINLFMAYWICCYLRPIIVEFHRVLLLCVGENVKDDPAVGLVA